jgi:hypothetical protein
MKRTTHRILRGFGRVFIATGVFLVLGMAQDLPKTTQERITGTPTVKTEQLQGTVVYVEGNDLVVNMSTGDTRIFHVPESREFIVDNKTLSVHDLKPGTKLTATVSTTTTPVTQRTTTVGTGKVWFVSGNNVILTLPNNENRMYKVQDSYRFNIGGQKASVHDLRKGMVVSAEKIVEEPMTEIASNVAVVGQAPPAPTPKRTEVAQTRPVTREPAPPPTPAPVRSEPVQPTPPAQVAAAPAPASLPKTASPLPLAGLLGLLFTSASLGLRTLRRSGS